MRFFRSRDRERLDFMLGTRRARPQWRRRRVLIPLSIAAGIIGFVAILTVPPALRTTRAAKTFQERLTKAQALLVAQRFDDARKELKRASRALDDARDAFRPLRPWGVLPMLGSNVRAADGLLDVSETLVVLAGRVTDFVDDLIGPFVGRGQTLTLASLSVDDRTQILDGLGEAEPTLLAIKDDLRTIADGLDRLPRSLVKSRVDREIGPLRENFSVIEEGLERAAPVARILPKFLGHGSRQTYLFLLQNNTELRPTGGFIGTYGIMKVQDGEITAFETENSYNLDNRAKDFLKIRPPQPLKDYNSAERWWFRDANWSPDFPTSAAKAAELYRLEGGRERLDGVLAVTPTFIESLLALTGSISVNGVEFTEDNFVETLQELTTYGYYRQGVPESERKEIIGAMGQELMSRIYDLPQTDWGELWRTMLTQLSEKQVLLNFFDDDLQSFALEQGWGGAVQSVEGDFLLLVDANLAALKTDPVVQRRIAYRLEEVRGRWQATTTITYEHTGTFTEKTTRYRTYLRLLVPLGSELISSEGADLTDRSDRPGQVTTGEELGKTVFAAFKSIEPGTTETIRFTYALPGAIADEIADGRYTLLVQKQPGTVAHALSLDLEFGRTVGAVEGIDSPDDGTHTTVSHETDLRTDRAFSLQLSG